MKKKKIIFFFEINLSRWSIHLSRSHAKWHLCSCTPLFSWFPPPLRQNHRFINQPFTKKYYFSILLRIFKEKRLILVQPLNQSPRGKYINLIWTNIYSRNSIFPFWQLAFLKLLASDKMTTKQTAWLKSFRWTYK